MTANSNEVATPLPSDNNQIRDRVKLDVYRIYKLENETLETTMAVIQQLYGLNSCPRTWKYKLNEWGYRKNRTKYDTQSMIAQGTKRALEGKDTPDLPGATQSTGHSIENCKRRRTIEVSPSVPLPLGIECYTPPGFHSEGDHLEDAFDDPYHWTGSHSSNSCYPQVSPIGALGSEIDSRLTTGPRLMNHSSAFLLDGYLYDWIQPWSACHMFHQLGNHDSILAKHRQLFVEVSDVLALSDQQSSLHGELPNELDFPLGYEGIGEQFSEDCNSVTNEEQGLETSEELDLKNLLDLAVALAELQNKLGEFAPETLEKEFALAKAVRDSPHYEEAHAEAEYHFRRILRKDHYVSAQMPLGMILANTGRLEEAEFLLFSAITHFIVEFTACSVDENRERLPPIESLFGEMIWKSEVRDWKPLSACFCQMLVTIHKSIEEGTIDQIFPQLVIHGYSFAHACLVLGITNSAKDMYDVLLEKSSGIDVILCGIKKATAHQEYGLLLRREGSWTASAK